MIPATARFIWFGDKLPFLYMVALRSAAVNGGFQSVVLHGEEGVQSSPFWDYLEATPGFRFEGITPNVFLDCGLDCGEELHQLFSALEAPAAKANMVRAALLYREGGVYLDTDTVTVGSFQPLLAPGGFFCGNERICFPGGAEAPAGLASWARSVGLLAARDAVRRLPRGWKLFRRLESSYHLAANNAVMGSEAGHTFVKELLQSMVRMDKSRQFVRFALGTHLLQQCLERTGDPSVRVYPPEVFFPLSPEISQHWFRNDPNAAVGEMLRPETRVVHWYASVRTKAIVPTLTPSEIERRAVSVPLYRMIQSLL